MKKLALLFVLCCGALLAQSVTVSSRNCPAPRGHRAIAASCEPLAVVTVNYDRPTFAFMLVLRHSGGEEVMVVPAFQVGRGSMAVVVLQGAQADLQGTPGVVAFFYPGLP